MKHNQVRIIGGQFRGRKITFPEVEDLRPTPDRVRETLFNWLAPYITESHCLDLFAGSGALGFEAISRGAHKVVAIESNAQVMNELKENAKKLEIAKERFELIHTDSLSWLQGKEAKQDFFDIIFLDPPYSNDCLPQCLQHIADQTLLKSQGLIYFESDHPFLEEHLPSSLEVVKESKAGHVYFYLAQAKS